MEITDGVHTLPIDFEFMGDPVTVHPVAIETGRGLLLVDAGIPGTTDQLAAGLADAGFKLDDVAYVLVTHGDTDHAGGVAEVVERTGATVFAHSAETPFIEGREDPVKDDGIDADVSPVRVDVEVVDSVAFRTRAGPVRVVDTPGHCPGHVSLYLPEERLLVSADALTAMGGDGLAGPIPDFTPDMDAAADSVGRLATFDVDRTLCYHGGLVEEGSERIEEIHASLAERA